MALYKDIRFFHNLVLRENIMIIIFSGIANAVMFSSILLYTTILER